jgi:uncharacterized OsmC-like protein
MMEINKYKVMTRTSAAGYTTEASSGYHRFMVDEPLSDGGNDKGPNPYDLILAALGACTGITIEMYSKRNNYPLTHVTVYLNHNRRHAEDCEKCEAADIRLDTIERVIELEGPLTEDQQNRLLEIAVKCPVSKSLQMGMKVETRLRR